MVALIGFGIVGIVALIAMAAVDHNRLRIISRSMKMMLSFQAQQVQPVQPAPPPAAGARPAAEQEGTVDQANATSPLAEAGVQLREWAFIDTVDVYQKAALLEIYGGTLTQKRTGPISVDSAVLVATAPRSWLVWTPDRTPRIDSDRIVLEFAEDSTLSGTATIGVILNDGRFIGWSARLGAGAASNPPPPAAENVPAELSKAVEEAGAPLPLQAMAPQRFVGEVPASLRAQLNAPAPAGKRIKSWVAFFDGPAPASVELRSLALVQSRARPFEGIGSEIAGKVEHVTTGAEESIQLLLETGEVYKTSLGSDGSFRFTDLPAGQAMSLRYRYQGQDYYAAQGRWFRSLNGEMPVTVPVLPEFTNPDGTPPDPKSADVKIEYDQEGEALTTFRYAKHRRTFWPGSGTPPQEFAGRSFGNNFGHLDRDRALDNRDRCLRIFVVGASSLVALQVKPGEKFNIVLESELGRRLGRCVEVITAGRDNGDIAANYRVIRDYGMKFKPDLVLIEHMGALAAQMEPTLLKRSLGWSYEHNVLDNFYFDGEGKLTFRSWDASWALDAVPASGEPLIPGLGLFDSFSIPLADFAPEAKASFKLFAAIARQLRSDFPGSRFALLSALDQARCHRAKTCEGVLKMPDGRVVPMGVVQMMANFSHLCKEAGIDCVQARIPEKAPPPGELLSYSHDGHYSVRGHQWLARELTEGIADLLSRKPPEAAR